MKDSKSADQHRVILTRYVPLDLKGAPLVPTYKVYKPAESGIL